MAFSSRTLPHYNSFTFLTVVTMFLTLRSFDRLSFLDSFISLSGQHLTTELFTPQKPLRSLLCKLPPPPQAGFILFISFTKQKNSFPGRLLFSFMSCNMSSFVHFPNPVSCRSVPDENSIVQKYLGKPYLFAILGLRHRIYMMYFMSINFLMFIDFI